MFSPTEDKHSGEIEQDYYTVLNLSRDATDEQIRDSYLRLSRFYHPDKHVDPENKKKAGILFTKTKKAYEVLSDPRQRAIYDALGKKGLETEGWELVPRYKNAQEIREEFERLERERQERLLQQRANPRGSITIGINASDLFAPKDEFENDDDDFSLLPTIEISSMSIDQSIDAPLSNRDTLSLTGDLHHRNGVGEGVFAASLRHVFSAFSWVEYQLNAGQGPLFGVKWFRLITNRSFFTINGLLHFRSDGIVPSCELVLQRQVTKNLEGYLTWKEGGESCVKTTVVWNNPNHIIVGRFQLGLPNTYLSMNYIKKLSFNDTKLKLGFSCSLFGAAIDYGYETRISQHSIVGTSVSVSNKSGVNLKLRLRRANQNYTFSILLCEEISPSPIFYGTVVPFVLFYCVKSFIIDPYNKSEKEKETQRMKQENAAKIKERRKEAEAAISVLQESYQRIVSTESSKSGLIIKSAFYGEEKNIRFLSSSQSDFNDSSEIFDVHVPLQCLVQDSHLTLPSASKANLPGFYDPCLGENKLLWVEYTFKGRQYSVIIDDSEKLKIPSPEHLKTVFPSEKNKPLE